MSAVPTRVVLDYLLHHGYLATAAALADDTQGTIDVPRMDATASDRVRQRAGTPIP